MGESYKPPSLKKERLAPDEGLRLRAEQLLEKIDFDLLRDIFQEERRRSDLDEETTNIQSRGESITVKPIKDSASGRYSPSQNKIVMDVDRISRLAVKNEQIFENLFFSVLCHEETHSVSTNPHDQSLLLSWFNFHRNRPINQTGISYASITKGFAFNLFNEAITDTIGEEVYDEYIKRSGDRNLFINQNGTAAYHQEYLNERNILRAFISAISRATNVPENTVWHGIKQSYFSNVNFASSELVKLYEEVLGKNIANIVMRPTQSRGVSRNAIRQLNNIESGDVETILNDLAKSIEAVSWSEKLIKRATSALHTLISPKRR